MSESVSLNVEAAMGTPEIGARPGRNWVRIIAGVVFAAVALYLPYQYNAETVNVFSQVLYLAIAAMGLNLLTGFNGQVSVGHGAFFGVGAFTSAILVVNHGMMFEVTIPIAAAAAALLGIVVGFPALRVKGLYLALITLGLAVLFPVVTKRFVKGKGGIALLQPKKKQVASYFPDVFADDQYAYFLCLALVIVLFLLAHNLMRSRAGRAMIAVRDQEVAASTVGVDVSRVKVITFALSAAYAGVAGALSVMVTQVADATNPLIYFQLSIEFLIAVVIGGAATITGPLVGAIALVFIRRQTDEGSDFLPTVLHLKDRSEQLAPAMLGGVLIVLTFILPDGVVGGLRRLRPWLRRRLTRSRPGPNDSTPPGSGPTPNAIS